MPFVCHTTAERGEAWPRWRRGATRKQQGMRPMGSPHDTPDQPSRPLPCPTEVDWPSSREESSAKIRGVAPLPALISTLAPFGVASDWRPSAHRRGASVSTDSLTSSTAPPPRQSWPPPPQSRSLPLRTGRLKEQLARIPIVASSPHPLARPFPISSFPPLISPLHPISQPPLSR